MAKATTVYAGEIPWNKNGLLHYPESWRSPVQWRENKPMTLRLAFSHFERGRSAAYAIFKEVGVDPPGETGDEFPMFLTDLGDLLRSGMLGLVQIGVVHGTFVGCKRGMNYGIRLVMPEQPERHDL